MIRKATTSDLPSLITLGERMRLESLVWYPPIEEDYLREKMEVVFSHPDKFCCFVIEDRNSIGGFLLGFETGYIFSRMKIAAHDIFYIAPEYRRYEYANGLVKAYIGWAESLGLKRQVIRLDTALRPEKVDRFYRRLGFQPIGGQYVRDHGCNFDNRGHC